MSPLDSSSEPEKKGSIFNSSWTPSETTEETSFRGISVVAILALIGGGLSSLCFVGRGFFFIPVLTLLLSVWAFWSIKKSEGLLIGGRLVRIALFLAIVPPLAVSIQDLFFEYQAVRQAKEFFPLVFKAMSEGDTFTLHQLKNARMVREVENEKKYWASELVTEEAHMEFHRSFLENELLLHMAALGDKAKATYYKMNYVARFEEEDRDVVALTYAITYPSPKDGKPESFLVKMVGNRDHFSDGSCGWSIDSYPYPEALKE